jgi:branched-chain amino acid transport system ATP-binding protein
MLEVDRIDVYYGDLQALWDVSLTIRGGEIAALVGSNGAGKSTLLKTICGLLRPTRGSIRFDSLRFDKTPAHQIVERGVCMVYEIFPRLKERKNQTAGTLSGGEQQMIAIGRALMSQPKLLLMDEVSLGLAPLLVQNIYDVVREINTSKQITIFLVEQNVRLALEVAERGYIIETGRIVKHDRADLLLSSEDVRESYLGFESGQKDI